MEIETEKFHIHQKHTLSDKTTHAQKLGSKIFNGRAFLSPESRTEHTNNKNKNLFFFRFFEICYFPRRRCFEALTAIELNDEVN